jgi:hypothetical protein
MGCAGEAYHQMNPDKIELEYDSICGTGSFKNLTQGFDAFESRYNYLEHFYKAFYPSISGDEVSSRVYEDTEIIAALTNCFNNISNYMMTPRNPLMQSIMKGLEDSDSPLKKLLACIGNKKFWDIDSNFRIINNMYCNNDFDQGPKYQFISRFMQENISTALTEQQKKYYHGFIKNLVDMNTFDYEFSLNPLVENPSFYAIPTLSTEEKTIIMTSSRYSTQLYELDTSKNLEMKFLNSRNIIYESRNEEEETIAKKVDEAYFIKNDKTPTKNPFTKLFGRVRSNTTFYKAIEVSDDFPGYVFVSGQRGLRVYEVNKDDKNIRLKPVELCLENGLCNISQPTLTSPEKAVRKNSSKNASSISLDR